MTESETADQIDEAAFAWVARLDRHGPTETLQADLDAWLAGDPRRRGALLRAEALWRKLDRAGLAEAAPSRSSAVTRRALVGGGAGLMAAGLAGVWLVLRDTSLRTTLGEVRRLPLADGSGAVLNTDSRASVAFRKDVRRVRLDRGEAWFHVAKDAARPFVVEAGPVRVQAVGTAFSVRRRENGADVLVTEGVVEAWLEGAGGGRMRLAAGEMAQVREGHPLIAEAARGGEIDRRLAWRAGKIDLDGQSLAEAVGEFNRFNRRKLVLKDARFAGRRLYGVFRADDPEGFARSAALTLGAEVRLDGDEIAIGG